jgi:hypothetical protein
MGEKMTWEEMKKAFPDEWLLIVDYETDTSGHVLSGVVERHSQDKAEVYQPPAPKKNTACKYTGESTFPGGWRSYAERHCI